MSSYFLEICNQYDSYKNDVAHKFEVFFQHKERLFFLEKWFSLHMNLLKNLNFHHSNEEEINHILQKQRDFIKLRERFLSSLVQFLKKNHASNFNQEKESWHNIILFHDSLFKNMLQRILDYYSEELVKINRLKKASSAYTYAHLS